MFRRFHAREVRDQREITTTEPISNGIGDAQKRTSRPSAHSTPHVGGTNAWGHRITRWRKNAVSCSAGRLAVADAPPGPAPCVPLDRTKTAKNISAGLKIANGTNLQSPPPGSRSPILQRSLADGINDSRTGFALCTASQYRPFRS